MKFLELSYAPGADSEAPEADSEAPGVDTEGQGRLPLELKKS